MAAILSDTLLLTSPTCTDIDRVACHMLADIAKIDIIAATFTLHILVLGLVLLFDYLQ